MKARLKGNIDADSLLMQLMDEGQSANQEALEEIDRLAGDGRYEGAALGRVRDRFSEQAMQNQASSAAAQRAARGSEA